MTKKTQGLNGRAAVLPNEETGTTSSYASVLCIHAEEDRDSVQHEDTLFTTVEAAFDHAKCILAQNVYNRRDSRDVQRFLKAGDLVQTKGKSIQYRVKDSSLPLFRLKQLFECDVNKDFFDVEVVSLSIGPKKIPQKDL